MRSADRPVSRPLALGLLALLTGAGCGGSDAVSEDSPRLAPRLLFSHPGSCRDCHGEVGPDGMPLAVATGTLADAATKRCTNAACHGDWLSRRAAHHAPLVVGECTDCHLPHASSQRGLLTLAEPRLCASCHERLFTCTSREHPTAACSDCHDSHGGAAAPYLLSTPQPRG